MQFQMIKVTDIIRANHSRAANSMADSVHPNRPLMAGCTLEHLK